MHQVSIDEAKARLEELMGGALKGETVVITTADQHGILLVPVTVPNYTRRVPRFKEFAKLLRRKQDGGIHRFFTMADDFDAPLPDFEEYMQ